MIMLIAFPWSDLCGQPHTVLLISWVAVNLSIGLVLLRVVLRDVSSNLIGTNFIGLRYYADSSW
jgi:hypothetical protein